MSNRNQSSQAIVLELCGQSLYGENWQSRMAKELKLTSTRRIRQFLSGEINVPEGIWAELNELLMLKQHVIAQTIDSILAIRKANDDQGVDSKKSLSNNL